MLSIFLSLLNFVVHELGHELFASIMKVDLEWKWRGFRLCWTAKNASTLTKAQRLLVGLGGFILEFLYAGFLAYSEKLVLPLVVAILHISFYNFYAKDNYNDFKFAFSK